MNFKIALLSIACMLIASGAVQAADTPTTQPAAAAAAPATQPAAPTALATVGTTKITSDRVEGPLKSLPANFPADRIGDVRKKILDDLIVSELVHGYLEAKKIALDPNEYATLNDKLSALAAQRGMKVKDMMEMAGLNEQRLRDQVRLKTLGEQATTDAKVDAFMKANPSCFNGTKVQASHILVLCSPSASTKDQKAAIAKLEKIAADIKAGKTTFEAAAKANSDCPSKEKGGDLGEFEFQSMVPPFAIKAFSMKVGEISGIVRTEYGFHIIKVTKRTDGTEKPGADAKDIAKRCLFSQLQGNIFNQALTTSPIVLADAK